VSSGNSYKRISAFVVATFALSSVVYSLMVAKGGLKGGGGPYTFLLMWCPGVAALAVRLVGSKSLRGMGWGWGKTRYELLAWGIPLAYTAPAYLVIWITGLVPLNPEFVARISERLGELGLPVESPLRAVGLFVLLTAAIGAPINCVAALGEEIGWRGLLVPELVKITTPRATALISGAIWSAWHYPFILWGGYNGGAPVWYALTCFTILAMGISFGMTWLRLKSGSLWTGVFSHASHNLFVQGVFTPLTAETDRSKYIVNEFGAALAIMGLVVAWVFWRRLTGLLQPAAEAPRTHTPDRYSRWRTNHRPSS
jgi:membrane protease YdiL (CAAX protease family)